MPVSAATTSIIAARRAVSTRLRPFAAATSRTVPLSCRITFAVQNSAVAVWAGVRVVLESRPIALISLNCATHSGLDSEGGGGGRNRSAVGTMNGFIVASHGVWGG